MTAYHDSAIYIFFKVSDVKTYNTISNINKDIAVSNKVSFLFSLVKNY